MQLKPTKIKLVGKAADGFFTEKYFNSANSPISGCHMLLHKTNLVLAKYYLIINIDGFNLMQASLTINLSNLSFHQIILTNVPLFCSHQAWIMNCLLSHMHPVCKVSWDSPSVTVHHSYQIFLLYSSAKLIHTKALQDHNNAKDRTNV